MEALRGLAIRVLPGVLEHLQHAEEREAALRDVPPSKFAIMAGEQPARRSGSRWVSAASLRHLRNCSGRSAALLILAP